MSLKKMGCYQFLPCLLLLSACAVELGPDAPPRSVTAPSATEARVEQLTAAMSALPGRLVVTRSTGASLDEAERRAMRDADKVIHVFSDGSVVGYVHFTQEVPGDGPRRYFKEHGGDIVIGPSNLLPDHLLQREQQEEGTRSAQGLGLYVGHGRLWADGTIAYEIDGSFFNDATDLETLRSAIGGWNDTRDGGANGNRVRFVPRYPGDGRAYVRFVRTGGEFCGMSEVGNKSTSSSNGFSHNVEIVCPYTWIIHHEMGHTAGLMHEQQRCDRDAYVAVPDTCGGINFGRYCGLDWTDHGPYNYRSIMHYPYDGVCLSQKVPTGSNYYGGAWQAGSAQRLDVQDVESLHMMYTGRRALPRVGSGIYYNLRPDHVPTRAVAVPGASPYNSVQLMLYDLGPEDQKWEFLPDGYGFFLLRNKATRKCMDVASAALQDGAAVIQYDCHGKDNQKWIIAPSANNANTFDIINKHSLKALDATGVGTANGTPMIQWGYVGAANQRFRLVQVF